MALIALICIIAAAVLELLACLNIDIVVNGKPLNLMCLGFSALIVGLFLLK